MSPWATDSSPLRMRNVQAYGLVPFPLTDADLGRMHAEDERIPIDSFNKGIEYLYGIVSGFLGGEVTRMNPRRAKIVCTLGPSSSSPAMIEKLVGAGMDVARLNFSHGTHADHAHNINSVRRASGHHQKPIAILADLQGPKIRTGALEDGRPVRLRFGQKLVITTRQIVGNAECVSTTFRALPESVHRGDQILLCDGDIALRVLSTRGREVVCQVENGGDLGEHKGINLPGIKLKIPSLTPKDRIDLAFALEHGADFVALSFVRTAQGCARGESSDCARGKKRSGDCKARKAGSHRQSG